MINQNTGSSKFEYQDLPPEIARQIYDMQAGDISKPFSMIDKTKNKEMCCIVKLKSKTNVHRANLVDDYQIIKDMLEKKQGDELIDNWIKKKQTETYVKINPDWKGCDFQYPDWEKK
jgi:peptidyl-prolyl cis-trans isomerase SurA